MLRGCLVGLGAWRELVQEQWALFKSGLAAAENHTQSPRRPEPSAALGGAASPTVVVNVSCRPTGKVVIEEEMKEEMKEDVDPHNGADDGEWGVPPTLPWAPGAAPPAGQAPLGHSRPGRSLTCSGRSPGQGWRRARPTLRAGPTAAWCTGTGQGTDAVGCGACRARGPASRGQAPQGRDGGRAGPQEDSAVCRPHGSPG